MSIGPVSATQATIFVGLGTFTYTVPSGLGGLYFVRSRSLVLPTSGLSVLIKQNASTVFTSATPSSAQKEIVAEAMINAAPADVISFVISSSNANDNMLNTVQTIIEVSLSNA